MVCFRRFLVITGTWLCLAGVASAGDIYVSGTGNDNTTTNDGSQGKPFRSLGFVAGRVNPGDTVWMMNGTYSPFILTRSGTSEQSRITWKALPGHTPELKSNGWNAIEVRATYQTIDGLIVTGNNDNVTLAMAEADYNKSIPTFFAFNPVTKTADINPATGLPVTVDTPNPTYMANYFGSGAINGNGITNRESDGDAHYLTVRNCTIRKFGGGGLGTSMDYQVYENNLIYENAWYSRYANSGISLFHKNAPAAVAGPGYRNIIRGNKVWNNRGNVKWLQTKNYSDGNGIIIDVSDLNYTGRTLIANNLVVNNGGSGIHTFKAFAVDIVNNTAFQNGQKVGYGDIAAQFGSSDVKLRNNVIHSRPTGKANESFASATIIYSNNLYFGGSQPSLGANDVVADPQFVKPNLDVMQADFRLKGSGSISPGIDTGVSITGVTPTVDIDGVSRPQGAGIDKGAFEYSQLLINSPLTHFGVVGTALTYSIHVNLSATTFTASGLPAGLFVDAITGVISGVPTEAGSFNAKLLASNAYSSGSATVLFAIAAKVPALPSGWSSAAVSNSGAAVDLAGESSGNGSGTWTLGGRSNNMEASADSFVAVWKPWTGNVTVTAKLVDSSLSQDWALSGIMLRESTAAGAKHVSTLLSPMRGVVYSRRQATGARTLSTAGPVQKAAVWLRLQRIGNIFISSSSKDGVTWTEVRRDTKTVLTPALQIGLVTSSANTQIANTATFSNVTVTP